MNILGEPFLSKVQHRVWVLGSVYFDLQSSIKRLCKQLRSVEEWYYVRILSISNCFYDHLGLFKDVHLWNSLKHALWEILCELVFMCAEQIG